MSLERAYRDARYVAALPEGEEVLAVGQASGALDRLLATHGVATAARLTAANPGSGRELAAAVNAAANEKLAADLDRLGDARLPCRSAGPAGEWPEEGFLALGLNRAEADRLARRYGQKGYLWIEAGRPVVLVMM
ncbi:DUF3293 domain-containing protein [Desertibaculum subflavum]|uniref:DUF3293 domain-containing protein n=1 Tax=Desertibaculum subflavum TaxID=2268458 RepID=UPI0013C42A3B